MHHRVSVLVENNETGHEVLVPRAREIPKVRDNLPMYIFSGSDDRVGQRLQGVRILIDRYRSAGLSSIARDFYSGDRHEMLHKTNRSRRDHQHSRLAVGGSKASPLKKSLASLKYSALKV